MDEKNMVTNESAEETTRHPVWEVVPDPIDVEAVEEKLEEMGEAVDEALGDAEKELKRGLAAAKEWLHSTLYRAGCLIHEHKVAVIAIVGAAAAVLAAVGVLLVLLKKRK